MQKQKTEKKRRERLNDGNNNGQATHGARKHAWRTQAAWAKISSFPILVFVSLPANRCSFWFDKFYHLLLMENKKALAWQHFKGPGCLFG